MRREYKNEDAGGRLHPQGVNVALGQTSFTSVDFTGSLRWAKWLLVVIAMLLLAACGGGGQEPDVVETPAALAATEAQAEVPAEEEPAEEPAEGEDDSTSADFPVTIEHKFGSITLESVPQRVVSIGFTDHDNLMAMGVMPVAVRYWFGDTESAIFPWAKSAVVGDEPAVLNMEWGNLNYELILSHNPDLIIAVGSGITEDEYTLLSEIAPVLAQSGDYNDYGMPWQEATRLMARAVGKSAEAETVIAGVEQSFADAKAAHPEFAGKTIIVATGRAAGGTYAFFSSQDGRTRYFTDLGFTFPEELDEITGESFYAEISEERIDLLDRDLIVFSQASYLENGADTLINDPFLNQLDAFKEGRYVILSEEIDAAFSFGTVLSLTYVNEVLVPQLAEALAAGQ